MMRGHNLTKGKPKRAARQVDEVFEIVPSLETKERGSDLCSQKQTYALMNSAGVLPMRINAERVRDFAGRHL
jgi:hypothetical protein